MKDIVITPAHILGGVYGMFVGMLVGIALMLGVQQGPDAVLAPLAQCDVRGWITVRFPGGGEFMCTPTEQRPVAQHPTVKKIERVKRIEKIEPVVEPKEG